MASTTDDGLVAVTFTAQSHPGVRAMGPYRPGQTYRVAATVAERLVAAKGFLRVASTTEAATAAESTTPSDTATDDAAASEENPS